VMQFTEQEEGIYHDLVSTKNKKATQVKYELTRPRKKQKKVKVKELSLNTEYSTVIDQNPTAEPIYSKIAPTPPTRLDSLHVTNNSNHVQKCYKTLSITPSHHQMDINSLPLPTKDPQKPPFSPPLQERSIEPQTFYTVKTEQDNAEELLSVKTSESANAMELASAKLQNLDSHF